MRQPPDRPRSDGAEFTEAGGHPIAPAEAGAEITPTPQSPGSGRTRNGGFALDARVPPGPIAEKWDNHRFAMKLVNPANRRKYTVIVVGTGLAGGAAAATLGELGYRVKSFCYQDSPRRAHSIAAQGGINAAKNYQNDGDSIQRLFYDTVKGGDFRSREANVYRLAQLSVNIIDQAVAQGVPFAREYSGLLDNRSFGGAQVARTFYARGQTGQQLLLGCYQALERQIDAGTVDMYSRHEMLDLVLVDGRARGILVRDMVTGELERHMGDAVVLATGGYATVFFLSTNAKGVNVTASYRAYRRGAGFANPCFTQIHPTCIPPSGHYQSKLTLMSESLRNDGRIWVPKKPDESRAANQIPESERDYYLERLYPSFGNLTPRDIASRRAKEMVDGVQGVGPLKNGVYLDFKHAIERLGQEVISERYGNLFEMYEKITGEDPYRVPMRIYPAPHYTMGGLWVDYNLMSTIPGLFVAGEANFSDHGANRLGASALMQGLADGYFIIPSTVGDYLAQVGADPGLSLEHESFLESEAAVARRTSRLLAVKGERAADTFWRELGTLMWDECGMARSEAGLRRALERIPQLREEFWRNVRVPGSAATLNQSLEIAGRVADFMEFAELLCWDALERDESAGAHYRVEHTTEEGEAKRDDSRFQHVAVWEHAEEAKPIRHREELVFDYVKPSARSYK
ncbi:MAG TPA: fumarate reductase/succinate dehydrogenase flavoprotein subunit [Longimicrobiales bacterium]|nr:fumarate reductase/succinate dehydrogenase flavoprotein subunit [Longimicrobiales bacterium]